MAGIDKIYIDNKKDLMSFYDWCVKFRDFALKDLCVDLPDCFYFQPEEWDEYFGKSGYRSRPVPITNFSKEIDMWLWKHCPIEFVRERLKEQYRFLNDKVFRKTDVMLYIDRG